MFPPFHARFSCSHFPLLVAIATVLLPVISLHPAQAQTSVLTQRYDNARSGCNTGEATLNTSNVVPGKFGKLFSREVAGEIYAQPLIVAGLKQKSTHNFGCACFSTGDLHRVTSNSFILANTSAPCVWT